MKITKTIKKEETVEVDVTLPYFSKTENEFYAILSDELVLRVYLLELDGKMYSASIHCSNWMREASQAHPSNEVEFQAQFNKADDFIADSYESMRDTLRDRKYGVVVDELVNEIKNIVEGEE